MIDYFREKARILSWELKMVAWATSELEAMEKKRANGSAGEKRPRHFTITTHFLMDICLPYLMKLDVESVAYLSGIRCKETTVIDQLVTFRMEVQNTVYARGEPMSVGEALIGLDERGFLVEGTIHCHPGYGESATEPSGIDQGLHHRLETGGYKALGIIVTRDGYLRFYTDRMPFEVTVVGTDAVKLSPISYRLLLKNCDQRERERGLVELQEGNTEKGGEEDDNNRHAAIEEQASVIRESEAHAGGTGCAGIPDRPAGEGARLQPGIIA